MRKNVGPVERVALVGLGAMALLVTIGWHVRPALARPSKAERCSAAKAGASGQFLGSVLACHAKARQKSVAPSMACLDKAGRRFDSALDDAACPGDADVVRSVVDACIVTLTADVSGTGKCAGTGLRALGAGARALGGCEARDVLHPGKGTACEARAFQRLDAALAKAAACTAASARDDLMAECWPAIRAALAGASTSTTTSSVAPTTSTATSQPITSTTSTTTTSTPPTTGQTFPSSTSTSSSTSTTTTVADTTTTTSTVADTTTTIADTTTTTSTIGTTTTTVECMTPATCPGTDTECRTRTCTNGMCGVTFTPGDTIVTDQQLGNCHDTICDGAGGFAEGIDDGDLPVDGNPCTDDMCTAGTPSNPPTAAGTSCSMLAPLICDGDGNCVQCLVPQDCPGIDTECSERTCVLNQCGVAFAPEGTPLAQQVTGDCHTNQCDGAGGTENVIDDGDADDLNECTTDSCVQGTPTHTPLPDMTPCTNGECNMGFCCPIGEVCG